MSSLATWSPLEAHDFTTRSGMQHRHFVCPGTLRGTPKACRIHLWSSYCGIGWPIKSSADSGQGSDEEGPRNRPSGRRGVKNEHSDLHTPSWRKRTSEINRFSLGWAPTRWRRCTWPRSTTHFQIDITSSPATNLVDPPRC